MEGARSTWRGGSQYPQTPRDAPQVRATGSFLSSAVLQRCRRHFGRFPPRLGPCAGGHEAKTTPSGPLLGLFSAGTLARSVSGSARILRTAMSRRPIFPRQPGRTRHAGPGRLRGARENAAHRARRPKSAQRQKKKERELCCKRKAVPWSAFSATVGRVNEARCPATPRALHVAWRDNGRNLCAQRVR